MTTTTMAMTTATAAEKMTANVIVMVNHKAPTASSDTDGNRGNVGDDNGYNLQPTSTTMHM
jgi:hypothetical protein